MPGWVVLALWIIAYDAWALSSGNKTLSCALFNLNIKPKNRFCTTSVWGILTYHLFLEKEAGQWLKRFDR